MGEKKKGLEGDVLLRKGKAALDAALNTYNFDTYPLKWAHVQSQLGVVQQEIGSRAKVDAAIGILNNSVRSFKEAHKVYKREHLPYEWAKNQCNLGCAYTP